MAKLAPALGVLAVVAGGGAASASPWMLLALLPAGMGLAWWWRRRPRAPEPVEIPSGRTELGRWLRRRLAATGRGHLAQRVDRAFARAQHAWELAAVPGFLHRPSSVMARVEAFDDRARQLAICVAHGGTVEEALYELEAVLASIERSLPD